MPDAAPPRRLLAQRALGLAWRAWLGGAMLAGCAAPQVRLRADPFALGVASGSPAEDGVVLWTRLAPEPRVADGGMAPLPVEVRWQVAEDDAFRRVVRSGTALAVPERAHSVHVEVDGLAPARWYHYRFMAGSGADHAVSPTGRTRTAPAPDAVTGRLRFAFASCQHYEQGWYGAYRHMREEDLDLVVFLGDYIYESSWGRDHVRKHWSGEPRALDEYRVRHAQYRTDPDLQAMHAAAPWLCTWDDHEVDNDYANDRAEDLATDFLRRREAAYRAYFEHMPLRALARPVGASMQLYGRHRFGRLAEFFVLDGRQYRDHQACPRPGRGGGNFVDARACAALRDPGRSMLGARQERWLERGLAGSATRWTVLAQQTLFSRVGANAGGGGRAWTDGWDGYPQARQRILDAIARHRVRNPLVIGGDVHANWVCDVKADFGDPRSPTIATEFCTTSITSQGLPQAQLDRARAGNAHVRLAESTRRGYVTMQLEAARCTTTLRVLDSEKDPATSIATRARFVVEDGRPGALA